MRSGNGEVDKKAVGHNLLEAGKFVVTRGLAAFAAIEAVQLLTQKEVFSIPEVALVSGIVGAVWGLAHSVELGNYLPTRKLK